MVTYLRLHTVPLYTNKHPCIEQNSSVEWPHKEGLSGMQSLLFCFSFIITQPKENARVPYKKGYSHCAFKCVQTYIERSAVVIRLHSKGQ